MISTLILTRNEELDLPGCLASVSWCDDVHVFDSFSTDRTIEIATASGAHVTQRAFDDYATHRNAALAQLPFRHPWVFLLDADERPTPELSAELQRAATTPADGISGFRMARRDYLWDTWLKHAQLSPFYTRLVRPGRVHYTRAVNEFLQVEGGVEDLQSPLLHYPFSKGISHWIRKHDVYSTMEAELIHNRASMQNPSLKLALTSADFHERRLHQKALFYRMPGRPLIKLLYMLLVRRAILDGHAGVTYAILQSIYEYFIVLKTEELRRKSAGPNGPGTGGGGATA